jgi:hypothetical protein
MTGTGQRTGGVEWWSGARIPSSQNLSQGRAFSQNAEADHKIGKIPYQVCYALPVHPPWQSPCPLVKWKRDDDELQQEG